MKQLNEKTFKIGNVFTWSILFLAIFAISFNINFVKPAIAASNLIKGGDFEGDINAYWDAWSSSNTIDFYRSYDASLGNCLRS